ncbi:MAG: acetolactate synthase small subunit [bacterium]
MKHTISVIVENKPGVLHRVSGMFSRRGFNIESLAVGTTAKPNVSRMTIVVTGDDLVLEQITKQLYKQIDVLKVFDIPDVEAIDRELILVKVKITDKKDLNEITKLAEMFQGKVVNVTPESAILEVSAEKEKIEDLQKLLDKFGIIELVRTGKIALQKGDIPRNPKAKK